MKRTCDTSKRSCEAINWESDVRSCACERESEGGRRIKDNMSWSQKILHTPWWGMWFHVDAQIRSQKMFD